MKTASNLLVLICLILINFYSFAQEPEYKTMKEKEKEELEKLKILKKSTAFSIQYGHFELMSFAKIKSNNSNINIDDYHKLLNLVVEYYPYENAAILFSAGVLFIPKEKTIDSITWTPETSIGGVEVTGKGKGGAVLPVTIGIKKTFLNGFTRPYIYGATGFTYIKVGSGTGSGTIDGIDKNIDIQSEIKFCWQFGTGIQHKVGKVVRFDLGINYYGTPMFSKSIGGIDYFHGFYVFGGLNFIIKTKH